MELTEHSSMLEWALFYARSGFPVFPLRHKGKAPVPGSTGFKEATTDTQTIETWWQANYNFTLNESARKEYLGFSF